MNLKDILIKKANYPVRLIAVDDESGHNNGDFKNYFKGDEIGIEVIDFSCGNLRVVNKTREVIFYLYYDKESWIVEGNFKFKN